MKKMLIIEDHIGLRESYQILFTKEGYEVTVAEDGQDGLEQAKKTDYDVILLDMMMPVMDGITFLREYQPSQHTGVKVIAFSNLQTPEIVKEATSLGVDRYITKSTTPPGVMAEVVREVAGTTR